MKKLIEHTYGSSIYMKILMDDGKEEEINRYCGVDYSWNHYRTTADEISESRRNEIISAFHELY